VVQPSTQLFCFPYAGASAAAIYGRWRRHLQPSIEVVPIELPGRGRYFPEPLETTMDGLLARIEARVAPRRPARFALFGHSLGALVAFAVARRLEQRGDPAPCAVFASACEAPSASRSRPLMAELSDAALIAELRRLGGTPTEVLESTELLELTLPILRADFRVVASYRGRERAGETIGAPIHVLSGIADDHDGAAVNAWRGHTRSAFSLRQLAGGHFFIHERERDVLDCILHTLGPATALPASDGAGAR
jgi:surfactin synthase thioesterase subunit